MVLTDTPGIAFDKIRSWDLSRLPKADIHIYSQYKIYSRNTSWRCYPVATSAEIAEALVEKFINLYTAPKAWITDQGPNFVNKVMRHIAHKYKISTYKNIFDVLISIKQIDKALQSCTNRIPKTMVTKPRLR